MSSAHIHGTKIKDTCKRIWCKINMYEFERVRILACRGKLMSELHPDLVRILLSQDDIKQRVGEMAQEISEDFKDIDRLYIIGILKGAFIFLADLTRQLKLTHIVDFMALSSYGRTTESGAVRILMDLREPVEGQHILVVEDIVDTGHTLDYLLRILKGRNPASIHTCALVKKESERVTTQIDYLGFTIPDVWVVGYGLDYADLYRTLPYVAELKNEVYSA